MLLVGVAVKCNGYASFLVQYPAAYGWGRGDGFVGRNESDQQCREPSPTSPGADTEPGSADPGTDAEERGVSTGTHSACSRASSRTTALSSKNCSTNSPNLSQAEGKGAGRRPLRDRGFGGRGPYHRQRRSRGKSGIEREETRQTGRLRECALRFTRSLKVVWRGTSLRFDPASLDLPPSQAPLEKRGNSPLAVWPPLSEWAGPKQL